MDELNLDNKNYLLSTIKSKALEEGARELKKSIDEDSTKPTNYNIDKDKINLIIATLYAKIGTAQKRSSERKDIINTFFSSAVTPRQPSTSVSSKSSPVTLQTPKSSKSSFDFVFTNPSIKTKEEAENEKKKKK